MGFRLCDVSELRTGVNSDGGDSNQQHVQREQPGDRGSRGSRLMANRWQAEGGEVGEI